MKKKITVIGLGYVGFPTYLLILKKKFNVLGYDKNKKLLKDIQDGKFLSKEPSIQKLYKKNLKKIKLINKLEESDIFIICVPTPIKKNKEADISLVNKAIKEISLVVKKNNCIIIESTCPPKTTIQLQKKYLPGDVMMAYCPERVFPGNSLYEIKNNTRVIGGTNDKSTQYVFNFYKKLGIKNIKNTTDIEAELIKLVENSFRDTTIAFANEVSSICEQFNLNANKIIDIANTHPRIKIPKPGIGVGGHCIPVDPYFLMNKKYASSLIKISRKINDMRPFIIAKKITKIIEKFKKNYKKNPRVLLLGKSYKPNTDDIRNSPAITIFNILEKKNKKLTFFDPIVDQKNISRKFISEFDIIFELVPHNKFKFLDKIKNINLIKF